MDIFEETIRLVTLRSLAIVIISLRAQSLVGLHRLFEFGTIYPLPYQWSFG